MDDDLDQEPETRPAAAAQYPRYEQMFPTLSSAEIGRLRRPRYY